MGCGSSSATVLPSKPLLPHSAAAEGRHHDGNDAAPATGASSGGPGAHASGRWPGGSHLSAHTGVIGEHGSLRIVKREAVLTWIRDSASLDEVLASAIVRKCNDFEEITDLRPDEVEQLVVGVHGDLVKALSAAVTGLRKARAHAQEQQEAGEKAGGKFSSGDVATYGSLSDFYSGLDGRLGLPAARLLEGMQNEHNGMPDSNDAFTTANYNTTTTPALEWEFVVCPQLKGREYPGGRSPVALSTFVDSPQARAAQLSEVECAALRLYSGPCYMKYQAALRGAPPSLVDGLKGNTYTTTLALIASGVIKLSRTWRMPQSRKVYRGLAGLRLPEAFFIADPVSGCCGGVEIGLMSTTTRREVAAEYCLSEQGRMSTLLELECGMIDRGADLAFISQYPGESEVLFPPLSNLEVLGKPRVEWSSEGKGMLIVIPGRINANHKTLTVEELQARRKQHMLSMVKTLYNEARRTMRGKLLQDSEDGGLADRVLGDFTALVEETSREGSDRFNDDAFYRDTVNRVLSMKVGTERKWALLHGPQLGGGGAQAKEGRKGLGRASSAGAVLDEDLRARVLAAPTERFSEDGFLYELRSGTGAVPFTTILSGSLDVVTVPALGAAQADVLWECVHDHSPHSTVQVASTHGGRIEIDAHDIMSGDAFSLPNVRLGAADVDTILAALRHHNGTFTSLSLTNNSLGDSGATAVACALKHCPKLLSLNLGDNRLGPDAAAQLGAAVGEHCTGLTSLRLAWNRLGDQGYTALAPMLTACTQLQSIDGHHTFVGAAGAIALAKALKTSVLTKLDLGSNAIGDAGMTSLVEVLRRNVCIKEVDFLACSMGADGARVLGEALMECGNSLEKIGSSMNMMGAQGMDHLAPVLRNNTALRCVTLGGEDEVITAHFVSALQCSAATLAIIVILRGQMQDEAGQELARVLGLCKSLSMLWVVDMDDEATRTLLANVSESNILLPPSLTSFHFSEGLLGDTILCQQFAGMMENACNIKEFSLRGNHISCEGLKAICGPLSRLVDTLVNVCLSSNEIRCQGCMYFCEALKGSKVLQTIDLSMNKIRERGAKELFSCVKTWPSLTVLDVEQNRGMWSFRHAKLFSEDLEELVNCTHLKSLKVKGSFADGNDFAYTQRWIRVQTQLDIIFEASPLVDWSYEIMRKRRGLA